MDATTTIRNLIFLLFISFGFGWIIKLEDLAAVSAFSTSSCTTIRATTTTTTTRRTRRRRIPIIISTQERHQPHQLFETKIDSQELENVASTPLSSTAAVVTNNNNSDEQQQRRQVSTTTTTTTTATAKLFDIDTALFCAGLAFDSYVEPPANSSRWERGVSN
jgi:hypothetical protein